MDDLDKLIKRVESCCSFGALYSLADDFSPAGLVLTETMAGKMVLCRVEDGKPVADKMADDFLFVGHVSCLTDPISDKLTKCMTEFIRSKASDNRIISKDAPKWQQSTSAFGPPLAITDEHNMHILQDMAINESMGTAILDAIKEWLSHA